MASFCCYGNLDPVEMYLIWNFRLFLAHHQRLIFRWTDNCVALVGQSWTVSSLKNPIEPPWGFTEEYW